jgi:hypothetical protein
VHQLNGSCSDWRAGAFLLKRKHKKDWGRHEQIDATVSTQRADEIKRRLLMGRELMNQYNAQEREKEQKQTRGEAWAQFPTFSAGAVFRRLPLASPPFFPASLASSRVHR